MASAKFNPDSDRVRLVLMRKLFVAVPALWVAVLAGCVAPGPPQPDELAKCQAGVVQITTLVPATCVQVGVGNPWGGFTLPTHIYVAYGYGPRTIEQYRDVTAHEAGHAFDFNRLGPTQHAAFAAVMGVPWNIETYADVYAWAVWGVRHMAYGGTPPSDGQAAQLRALGVLP